MTRRIETEDSLLEDDVFEPDQCAGSPRGGASSAPSRSERTSSAASNGGHDGKTHPAGVRISVGSELEDVIHKVSGLSCVLQRQVKSRIAQVRKLTFVEINVTLIIVSVHVIGVLTFCSFVILSTIFFGDTSFYCH